METIKSAEQFYDEWQFENRNKVLNAREFKLSMIEMLEEYAQSHKEVTLPSEIKDIIDCILKWDTMHNSRLANANYLAVIQRDLKKAIKSQIKDNQ